MDAGCPRPVRGQIIEETSREVPVQTPRRPPTPITRSDIASSGALASVAIAVLLGDDVETMFTILSEAVQQAIESGD